MENSGKSRENKIVKVSIIGIITNILLVIVKAIIGVIAKSTAVILDAVNNLADAFSSIVTIVGTKLANKKPTKKHPYGYGRIEHLTSIVVAVIVLVAGITAVRESIDKIINPAETHYEWYSFLIISLAIVVKLALGLFTKKAGKKYNSDSLVASGSEALYDSIVSIMTLIGAIILMTVHVNIEGYLSIVISALIIKTGCEILIESISNIIGERVESDLAAKIKDEINSFEEVHGAYDLLLNKYGPEKIIGSVHVEVDDNMKAYEIHRLSQQIANKIYNDFGIVLTVGIYATNENDNNSLLIKSRILELIKDYQNIIQMHGFYLDNTNKVATFDLVFNFKEKNRENIINELALKLENEFKYKFFINIDTDYSD